MKWVKFLEKHKMLKLSQEGKTLDQVNNKLVWFSNNYPTSTAINKQNKNIRFQWSVILPQFQGKANSILY